MSGEENHSEIILVELDKCLNKEIRFRRMKNGKKKQIKSRDIFQGTRKIITFFSGEFSHVSRMKYRKH